MRPTCTILSHIRTLTWDDVANRSPFLSLFVFYFMTEDWNCFAHVQYDMYQQAMKTRTGIQTLMHCSSDLWCHRKRFLTTDESSKQNIDLLYNNQLGVRFIYWYFNSKNNNKNVLHIIERRQKFLNIYLKHECRF